MVSAAQRSRLVRPLALGSGEKGSRRVSLTLTSGVYASPRREWRSPSRVVSGAHGERKARNQLHSHYNSKKTARLTHQKLVNGDWGCVSALVSERTDL